MALILWVFLAQLSVAYGQLPEGWDSPIMDAKGLRKVKDLLPQILQQEGAAPLAKWYKIQADYFGNHENMDSTIFYYGQALKNYEKTTDSFNIIHITHRLVSQQIYTGYDLPQAIQRLHEVVPWYERNGHYFWAAHAAHDLCTGYKKTGDTANWIQYLREAKRLNTYYPDSFLSVIIFISEAQVSRLQGNQEQGMTQLKQAISIARQKNYSLFLKVALNALAEDYIENGKLSDAQLILDESAKIELNKVFHPSRYQYHQLASLLNALQGNSSEAIAHYRTMLALLDSTQRKRDQESYDQVLMKFETEKQQAYIETLKKENIEKDKTASRRKMMLIGLSGGFGLLMVAGWFAFRNLNHKRQLQVQLVKQEEQFARQLEEEKQQKLVAELNKQLAEVQLVALNAQMNPHFIFNCMNSIQKFILKNERSRALDFLQHFSELMRMVLDNSFREKIALDEEISMLEKYILLEQQRLDHQFEFSIEVEDGLQTDFYEIPSMIIQPYVENAIWHGLMHRTEKGSLKIVFSLKGNLIGCRIEDNGVGRTRSAALEIEKSPRKKSYGMNISKQRLELLKQKDQDTPQIDIEDLVDEHGQGCGTVVNIHIPIH